MTKFENNFTEYSRKSINMLYFLLFTLCTAEDYEAWYIPEDKLARFPNHPLITSNKDVWRGMTLKEPIFKGKDLEGVNNETLDIDSY